MAILLRFPYDLLVRIALETALADPLGPPHLLTPLLCTCRFLHSELASSTDLYAAIFKAKFDITAPRRRVGPSAVVSRNLVQQLKTYCITLKRIRHADIYAPTLEEDLWNAYAMLLESDGKNAIQLREYARLPTFVNTIVRTRLWEDVTEQGWPIESAIKSLSVSLLWMVTDRESMLAEPVIDRDRLIRLLLPFVVCCFRYPAFHASDIHFNLPLLRSRVADFPTSLQTAHGNFPQYPSWPIHTFTNHFGFKIDIVTPPISTVAQLLYFARRELHGLPIPPNLLADRATSIAAGEPTGPTRADYENFNAHPCARLLEWGDWNWQESLTPEERKFAKGDMLRPGMKCLSSRFDADWERLTNCINPWQPLTGGGGQCVRYLPGSFMGRWVGRMFVPDEREYISMIQNPNLPPNFSEMHPRAGLRLLDLRIREHHCVSPQVPVRIPNNDGYFDEGLRNGYFPNMSSKVDAGGVTFSELEGESVHRYAAVGRSGEPEGEGKHDEDTCKFCAWSRQQDASERERRRREAAETLFEEAGVGMDVDSSVDEEDSDGEEEVGIANEPTECHGRLDIAFTGLTDPGHGDAWCHYVYYGRLREWDGLIVLVGIPNDVNAAFWGRWVFRGYLQGGQNYAGRWRHYSYDVYGAPYEGPFCLSKRPDD